MAQTGVKTIQVLVLGRIDAKADIIRLIGERALRAHGGRAWALKKDAAFVTTWTHHEGGRRSFTSRYLVKFPIDSGAVRTVVESMGGDRPVIMGISGRRDWFLIGRARQTEPTALRENRRFVTRAYRLLALPFQLDDPAWEFSYDGREVRAGMTLDRLRARRRGAPAGMFLFDRESGRLAGVGSLVADPPTTLVCEYREFTRVDGVMVPSSQVFSRLDPITGRITRVLTISIDGIRFDNGFPRGTFEPPPAR